MEEELYLQKFGVNLRRKKNPKQPNEYYNITPSNASLVSEKTSVSNENSREDYDDVQCKFLDYLQSEEVESIKELCRRRLPSGDVAEIKQFQCLGNMAFKCDQLKNNPKEICLICENTWKTIHNWLMDFLQNKLEVDIPVQCLKNVVWQISESVGLLIILQFPLPILNKPLPIVPGPICNICARQLPFFTYHEKSLCENCGRKEALVTKLVENKNLEMLDEEPDRDSRTLVFLCARKSSLRASFADSNDVFQDLRDSIEQAENNDGPFGKRNRPGFPTNMEFVGNFSARGTALAAISSMTIKVPGTPEPSYAISRITDIAVMRYKPGDTILIVISQPASLTVSPQHMDAFISELFARGIPKDSLYIYCHCLGSTIHKSLKYETIVKCEDLLNAIRENVTLCAPRPAVNAYILSMVNGVEERNNLPPIGRNVIDNSNRISNTQERRKEVEHAMYHEELCGLNTCRNFLGEEFAILCVSCKVWFHGSCVNISRKIATTLEKKKLEWSCDICVSAPVNERYPVADGSPPEKANKFEVNSMAMSPMFNFEPQSDNDSTDNDGFPEEFLASASASASAVNTSRSPMTKTSREIIKLSSDDDDFLQPSKKTKKKKKSKE